MNRIAITLALASVIACAAFGYEPPRHNGTYTTNGVTYAQRGGLGASDYVVTNVDSYAVSRVRSVNGMVGDVSIGAESVGAVARDADYLAVSNAAMGAVRKTGDTMSGDLTVYSGTDGVAKGVVAVYTGVEDVFTAYRGDHIVRGDMHDQYYYEYYFPNKTGTIALTSDIPSGQNITNAATWAAGNAYEDAVAAANAYTDASISETNEDFVAAVQAASPPVELPKKWALANVTNANGGAVTAADVGAVKKYVTSIDGTVELLSSTNMMYGLNGEENESSPSMMFAYTSPYYHSYRYDNYYGTHYYEFDKSTSPNKMSYASISLGSLWNGFGVYCDDGYGNISSVSLPYNANGYFAIESWASLSRTLNNTATNATFKAACADALERISESKPHFAIIDGEVHIITVTP